MPPANTSPATGAEPPHLPGRPTWLEIDLGAVVHNFRVARLASGPGCAVFPVIKANAYGLGALPIARSLAAAGAEGFCVALPEEAAPLRAAGIDLPLILLSGTIPGLEETILALNLTPVLFDMESARRLSRLRGPQEPPLPLFIKVDTGMGRMGFDPAKIPAVLAELEQLPGVRTAGILSHLACADDPSPAATGSQLTSLRELIALAPQREGLRHSLANSAGLLAHPATRLAWTRPGIMLYGASPFHPARTGEQDGLRPVVRWLTHILAIRETPTGTPLGYGHEFVTRRPSRIALLPVGYADGYSRILKGRARILTHGVRAPVVGRISMDLTLADVTDIPEAAPGSQVVLMGDQGREFIGVEELATWMETIPYEILCRLGPRLPRRYLPDSL